MTPPDTTRQILTHHADNLRRTAAISMTIRDTLETLDLFTRDGYLTQAIGASPPTTTNNPTYDGDCQEPTDPRWQFDAVGDWGHWAQTCDRPRPCPEHDTPVTLNSVEQAALTQQHTVNDRRLLVTQLDKISDALTQLEHITSRNARPAEPHALCNTGQGRDGHSTTRHHDRTTWGNPTCRNIPDPRCAGMCDQCFAAMNAWRTDHELDPIERTGGQTCKRCGIREATPGRTDGLCNADRLNISRTAKKTP